MQVQHLCQVLIYDQVNIRRHRQCQRARPAVYLVVEEAFGKWSQRGCTTYSSWSKDLSCWLIHASSAPSEPPSQEVPRPPESAIAYSCGWWKCSVQVLAAAISLQMTEKAMRTSHADVEYNKNMYVISCDVRARVYIHSFTYVTVSHMSYNARILQYHRTR